jgi:PBP1b-binding outer membrane lipoprotein LpoB
MIVLGIMLTGGCSLYKKACPNNNVQEQENKAFQVVRSSIL